MAGIDLGSASGQDALSPNLYPDIVHSTPFLLELFPEKVTDKEKKYTTTLYDYIAGHQRVLSILWMMARMSFENFNNRRQKIK